MTLLRDVCIRKLETWFLTVSKFSGMKVVPSFKKIVLPNTTNRVIPRNDYSEDSIIAQSAFQFEG